MIYKIINKCVLDFIRFNSQRNIQFGICIKSLRYLKVFGWNLVVFFYFIWYLTESSCKYTAYRLSPNFFTPDLVPGTSWKRTTIVFTLPLHPFSKKNLELRCSGLGACFRGLISAKLDHDLILKDLSHRSLEAQN